MYFEKDTVLRIISMMGEFFRSLMARADEKDRLAELDRFSREYGGIPLKALETLPTDTVRGLSNDLGRLYLAEALYMDGQLKALHDDELKEALWLKSLRLLSTLYGLNDVPQLMGERMRLMTDAARESMTAEDLLDCGRFYLYGGRYADCEDMVFLAAGMSEDREIGRGCESLLKQMVPVPNGELVLGGLPREELERSICDLNEMLSGREQA